MSGDKLSACKWQHCNYRLNILDVLQITDTFSDVDKFATQVITKIRINECKLSQYVAIKLKETTVIECNIQF